MELNKAIFLDKDGILIRKAPLDAGSELITLSDNSTSGLKKLMKAGYQLIVLSDQPQSVTESYNADVLLATEKRIDLLLRKHGIYLSGFYYCPFSFNNEISCDSILKDIAKAHRFDLYNSWMVGGTRNRIEGGNKANCNTVFVNDRNEAMWVMNDLNTPKCVVSNINQAADYILEMSNAKDFKLVAAS